MMVEDEPRKVVLVDAFIINPDVFGARVRPMVLVIMAISGVERLFAVAFVVEAAVAVESAVVVVVVTFVVVVVYVDVVMPLGGGVGGSSSSPPSLPSPLLVKLRV